MSRGECHDAQAAHAAAREAAGCEHDAALAALAGDGAWGDDATHEAGRWRAEAAARYAELAQAAVDEAEGLARAERATSLAHHFRELAAAARETAERYATLAAHHERVATLARSDATAEAAGRDAP